MPKKTVKQTLRLQPPRAKAAVQKPRDEQVEYIEDTMPQAAEWLGQAQEAAGTVLRKYESLQKFRRTNNYSTDYTENSYAI